jgi:DNA-binding NarL/FixJ family response regulator
MGALGVEMHALHDAIRFGAPAASSQLSTLAASCEGPTDRAISERLAVSVRTVEGHMYRIYAKLGVNDWRELDRVMTAISRARLD